MKIGFDATYSLGENLSGVGVYSRRILNGIPAAHPEARYLFCYRSNRFALALREPLPARCSRALLWKRGPASLDLFHALNQRLDSKRYRVMVTTFHDLFVITGEYSTPEFRARFTQQARRAAERSDRIIAVSEFTAGQVHELLGVERDRIRVIAHGCGRELRARPDPVKRERMILFVGAIQKRKNVAALVRAFERLEPGWKLVLAGSVGFGGPEIVDTVQRSARRSEIELPGYVSDAALENLYARASVFAFPSLAEGFGIPVLEAMARGVPVLTSNGSALREIAGDAALLVDPGDPESLLEGLRRITADAALREGLARRGYERSALYSWETAVDRTWDVYQELL